MLVTKVDGEAIVQTAKGHLKAGQLMRMQWWWPDKAPTGSIDDQGYFVFTAQAVPLEESETIKFENDTTVITYHFSDAWEGLSSLDDGGSAVADLCATASKGNKRLIGEAGSARKMTGVSSQ